MGDGGFRTNIRRQLILDWLAHQATAPGVLGLVGREVAAGRIGPKVSGLVDEIAASKADPPGLERLDQEEGARGSLLYALGLGDVVLEVLAGDPAALSSLQRLTGRDWPHEFRQLAKRQGHPSENAAQDVLSVVWELLAEIQEAATENGHRPRYRDQPAALAKALRHTLSDHVGGKRKPRRDRPGDDAPILDPAGGTDESGRESILQLRLAVDRADLTDRQADLIRLRLMGLEGKDLADALGLSTKATEKLQTRAFKKIRGPMGG